MNNPNAKVFARFSYPYFFWLFFLALLPAGVMFFLAFIVSEGVEWHGQFSLEHFANLTDRIVLVAFANSMLYAFTTTIICAILGYIVAYVVFCSKLKNKFIIITIFLLPMWSNLLLRTNALKNLMQENNIVVNLIRNIIPSFKGMSLAGTPYAVVTGLVITYLPFMILSIYNALEKIDYSLEEASLDLGVSGVKKFFKVIFPLSAKGIMTGSLLVFLPCASGFAVPKILGNGNIILIGNLIESNIIDMNYNLGSLLASIILLIILGALFIFNKLDSKGESLI